MPPESRAAIHETAREAIDREAAVELLEQIADEEVDDKAVEALREVAAESISEDVIAAQRHAKRRGRSLTADDIGDAADKRRGRPGAHPPLAKHGQIATEPAHGQITSEPEHGQITTESEE